MKYTLNKHMHRGLILWDSTKFKVLWRREQACDSWNLLANNWHAYDEYSIQSPSFLIETDKGFDGDIHALAVMFRILSVHY